MAQLTDRIVVEATEGESARKVSWRVASSRPLPVIARPFVAGGRLSSFKIPRYVLVVDEFPMTVTGKVQKFKMREDAIEQLGLEAAAAVKSA